jgi:diguanylate cyclase (GGDEF)-like protein
MPETLSPLPPGAEEFRAPHSGEEEKTVSIHDRLPLGHERSELVRGIAEYLDPRNAEILNKLLLTPDAERESTKLDDRTDENDAISLLMELAEYAKANFEDALTKMPNRRAFERQIEREKGRERAPGQDTYVYMVDVDDFKQYNTYLSHIGGDLALEHLSNQMRAIIDKSKRPNDFCGRYGGDEFVIVKRDMKKEEDAVEVGKRLIDQLAENWISMPISWVDENKHNEMRAYVRRVTEKERGFVESKLTKAQNENASQEEIDRFQQRLDQIDTRLANLETTDTLEVPLRISVGIDKVGEDNDLFGSFRRANLANNDVAKPLKVAGEEYTVATYSQWLVRPPKSESQAVTTEDEFPDLNIGG